MYKNMLIADIIRQIDRISNLETIQEKIEAINEAKIALNAVSPMKDHPIDLVLWVPISEVKKNDYNPNSVAPTELKLLETSIVEDGYVRPCFETITGVKV